MKEVSLEDVRPQKVMCGNAKLIGVIVPWVVIRHIPSKPHKDYIS
jgi:hypothetical protein